MFKTAAFVCLLAGLADSASAARPVTLDDLLQMRRVADATISPDGRFVLYTVRQWETSSRDAEKKEQRTQVWRVAVDGTGARALTMDDAGSNAPAWSPDGRFISFVSARRGGGSGDEPRPQIWIMRTDGGEATKVTDAKEGVASYAWSRDSKRIAYVSRDAESAEVEARRKSGDDRRIFEGEFRMTHLWVVDVDSQKATRVTDGGNLTVRGDVSWSPDSARLVFAAAPTPMLRDNRVDVYIATVADKSIEKITTNFGADTDPQWSPDGRTIAFATEPSTAKPGPDGLATQEPRQARLALYDVRTRTIGDASDPKFDTEPGNLMWAPDSSRVIFNGGKGTYVDVFSYEIASRRYTQLTTNRVAPLGTVAKNGATAFVMESATEPADVYASDLTFAAPRKVTTANPQASEFSLGTTEVMTWKNDGLDIEGVLVKPVGFTPGTKYPLLVVVHGGPAGAHLNTYRVGYGDGGQHWAGQGWAVLYPNPRGGTNYGEKFLRANIPDWGGGDFRDIMAGVDAAIAKGIADPDRLAIQGWSYGGYMTSWAITQTTRFKAAMVGAGITNLWSM
jgi:dipeptidyl aminopeptidase/acylaminoacyl peptidase